MDEPLRTYSAGMIMRLAFAIAVIAVNADPDILLIDEVLAVVTCPPPKSLPGIIWKAP